MAKADGYNLSQGEYARHRGITQPMVAKMIRQGKLEGAFVKDGRQYKIDPEKADAILSTYENPARAKSPPPELIQGPGPDPGRTVAGGLISFAEAARREKLAKAALLELQLRRQRGELVERARVEAAAAKLATIVRIGFEAIPAKVAPTVAGMSSPGDVARYLEGEIKSVLNNLSEGIENLDF